MKKIFKEIYYLTRCIKLVEIEPQTSNPFTKNQIYYNLYTEQLGSMSSFFSDAKIPLSSDANN
jgi:hypothetical protein